MPQRPGAPSSTSGWAGTHSTWTWREEALTSTGRTGMPMRRASATMRRAGYMPGSCSRMAAMKAAGWWVLSQAEW